jgi:hypothetical protein
MRIDFNINPEDFAKQIEEKAKEMARRRMREIGHQVQISCDGLGDQKGQPVDVILAKLKSDLASRDVQLGDDHLRTYAQAIADGKKITVHVDTAGL